MLSYWPAVAEMTTESERSEFLTTMATAVVPIEQEQTYDERPLDPITEPLLTRTSKIKITMLWLVSADLPRIPGKRMMKTEQRGSVNNESVVDDEEIVEEVDAAGAEETTTSRIRGIR
jgi:hypothetical protein